MKNSKSRAYGIVSTRECDSFPPLFEFASPAPSGSTILYDWRPGSDLAGLLPPGLGFSVQCVKDGANNRLFVPVGCSQARHDSFLPFLAGAWAAGFALLCNTGRMDNSAKSSYRQMWFFFQRVRKMLQFIRRSFRSPKDLTVKKSIQDEIGRPDILPWGNVQGQDGVVLPNSVEALIELGAKTASRIGKAPATMADKIHLGLTTTARRLNSPPRSAEKALSLIQYSLFDVGPSPTGLDHELSESIELAILETIEPYVINEEISYEEFDNWFWGRSNTFVKQVVSRVSRLHPRVDDDLVRHILLEMGWRSYVYVGQCIDAAMYDFRKALLDDLSTAENRAFEQVYLEQPHFGGLPLILLAERLDFTSSVVQNILANPDDGRAIGAFHTLLYFYVDMVEKRRYADRILKRRENGAGLTIPIIDEADFVEKPNVFSAIDTAEAMAPLFRRVQQSEKLECECGEPTLRLVDMVRTRSRVKLWLECAICGHRWEEPTNISLAELRSAYQPDAERPMTTTATLA